MQAHLADDVSTLLLRTGNVPGIDLRKVAAQLTARQKAVHKLPGWYANREVVFPPALSVEQASSETAAHYKAGLVSGTTLIDATGGMGVDTQAFAKRMGRVEYVDQNPLLAELAAHNLPRLGVENVIVTVQNGVDFVQQYLGYVDWIYLDPARRDDNGGKIVPLAGYEPDITGVLPLLLTKTDRILLKTSPLIDIDQTMRQLGRVEAVHVVAVQHEVKEILFVISRSAIDPATVPIIAVDLTNHGDGPAFGFTRAAEKAALVTLGEPQRYVCEPSAAVLKAGAFRLVATRFGLHKLAPHSHLYTAETRPVDFPGRVFEVQAIVRPDRSELRAVVPDLKANLTVRNFPQTVEQLRKKLGLREGGDVYILATTLQNGDKRLLVTRKPLTEPVD
ncbi:MAG: SAM-dependent methyltransferase [Bacteroidetes bacterium]|nr:SAM-dependent methyltransferase [Fibrella sp.]